MMPAHELTAIHNKNMEMVLTMRIKYLRTPGSIQLI
jgi:hypothetical protein